jgi:hypothetical protein
MKTDTKLSSYSIVIIIAATLLYWYWESIAQGNIRIDLFIIYPVLFAIYSKSLWRRYSFYSLLISALIMVLNIVYFVYSYELFDKYPG